MIPWDTAMRKAKSLMIFVTRRGTNHFARRYPKVDINDDSIRMRKF